MNTLSNKLGAAFWRAFYRVKLGERYNAARSSAVLFSGYLKEQNSSKIGIGRNYNSRGEQIRGWHRRSHHAPAKNSHPLIDKYCH